MRDGRDNGGEVPHERVVCAQAVADTAERFADLYPPLDQASRRETDQDHSPERITATPDVTTVTPADAGTSRMAWLWGAFSLAADKGTTMPELMNATGMSRPWIYLRLRELADQSQVTQVSRGRWRAVSDDVP